MEDMTGRSTRSYVFFLFRKKERTKEKSVGLSPGWFTGVRALGDGFFIRQAAYLFGFKLLSSL